MKNYALGLISILFFVFVGCSAELDFSGMVGKEYISYEFSENQGDRRSMEEFHADVELMVRVMETVPGSGVYKSVIYINGNKELEIPLTSEYQTENDENTYQIDSSSFVTFSNEEIVFYDTYDDIQVFLRD